MPGSENICEVMDSDGKCIGMVEVTGKPKYYVLTTVYDFELIVTYHGLVEGLVNELRRLVGVENVVWVSPLNPNSNSQYNPRRNSIRKDFIDAYNDEAAEENGVIIFNYTHGNKDQAGLIFGDSEDPDVHLFAITINPEEMDKSEYINMNFSRLTSEQIERIYALSPEKLFGDKSVTLIYWRETISKNYVCYQNFSAYRRVWRRKLPKAEFYFGSPDCPTRPTSESELLPRFLNDLVEETNKICPSSNREKYKFRCTKTECKNENNWCDDVSRCRDDRFSKERGRRVGIIELMSSK